MYLRRRSRRREIDAQSGSEIGAFHRRVDALLGQILKRYRDVSEDEDDPGGEQYETDS